MAGADESHKFDGLSLCEESCASRDFRISSNNATDGYTEAAASKSSEIARAASVASGPVSDVGVSDGGAAVNVFDTEEQQTNVGKHAIAAIRGIVVPRPAIAPQIRV